MKQWIMALVVGCGVLTLSGCANDYLITTNDGRVLEAVDKPEIDEDTQMLRYEDEAGRTHQIPQTDVDHIQEI